MPAQALIQRFQGRFRCQRLFHPGPLFQEALAMRMPLIRPMPQQSLPHARIAPQPAAVFQPGNVIVADVVTPEVGDGWIDRLHRVSR